MTLPTCAVCDDQLHRDPELHPLPALGGEECPSCGTHQLIPILYGYPRFDDGWPRDWFVGGCLVEPGQPTHACRACGLHLGPDGGWLRKTFTDKPTPVAQRPLPALEVGLADLFGRAIAALGKRVTLSLESADSLIPVGYTAGPWWADVAGLDLVCSLACGALAPEGARLSSYLRSWTGSWLLEVGAEWNHRPGLVHVHSVDEPIGSVLVRHPDGTVEIVHGVDALGLAEDALEHFAMSR